MRKLLKLAGLDGAVALAGSVRALGMILGPIGSFVVVWTLSAEEQGLYYLFVSLVSLRALFDLGATAAIAQMAPHLCKREGTESELPESEFIDVSVRWVNRVAVWFVLFCGLCGLGYLHWSGQASPMNQVMWLATVCATALIGSQEGRLQILYGSGYMNDLSRLRLFALLIQYPLQWLLLLSGASLLSFSVAGFAVYLFQRYLLRRNYPGLWVKGALEESRRAALKSEMLSLVKRGSLTYISGIFVFQIQQPIVFKLLGAENSAKLGFTGMIGSTLAGLASLWCITSFPRFARKVAHGEIAEGYHDFRLTFVRAAGVATLGMIAAIAAMWLLHHVPRFSERLMSIPDALPYFLSFWLSNVGLSLTYWPRSFKSEPFSPVAGAQMLVTPIAVWLGARWFGLTGVGWGNLASWVVGTIGIILIVRRYVPKGAALPQASSSEFS